MGFRGRGGRAISGGGRPRRPMDWIKGEIDSTQVGNPSTALPDCKWLCDPEELRHEFTDPTLMHTKVSGMAINLTAPVDNTAVFALGLIAWNFATDAAGNALTPTQCPRMLDIECQDEDWIWTWYAPLAYPAGIVITTIGQSDSKAMRRLGNDKGLLLVAQSIALNFEYHAHVRCLIKE